MEGYKVAFALWIIAIGLFIVAAPIVEIIKSNREMALREKEMELRRKELEQREVRSAVDRTRAHHRSKQVRPAFVESVDTDSPEYRSRYYRNYVN